MLGHINYNPLINNMQALPFIFRSSHHGAVETNLTRNHEVVGSIPGLAQWVKDPALPIRPLAWELPYATDAALKTQKKTKKFF